MTSILSLPNPFVIIYSLFVIAAIFMKHIKVNSMMDKRNRFSGYLFKSIRTNI